MGPLAFARSPLLTSGGKLRLLAEPLVRRGDPTGESVAEFAKRRFGCETRDGLIGPFLTGIYAGDESRLGAEAVFPSLVEAERRSGSIARGLLARALRGGAERGRRGTWSTLEGVAGLTDALARSLAPALRLRAAASSIRFENGSYQAEIAGDSGSAVIRARGLVVAVPAREAAPLVAGLDAPAGEALASIEYAPVMSVSLSLSSGSTRVPLRGFGYLVPRGEGEALLGCLFMSRLFPDRAPPGRELLTLLAGGGRAPQALEWPDDRVAAALQAEVDRVLGLREAPRVLAITRWPRAVPQPGREHPRLVAALRQRLARFPRLALAGAHLDGVAFGDALASGASAARLLLSA
jgi:oxygen-dependent protoporphyrinogen oxidase